MSTFKRYQFADADVVVLSDGVTTFPSKFVMVSVDDQERIEACQRWGFDNSAVESNMNVVYINSTSGKILFDTGAGIGMPGCGELPASLSAAGIDPSSIDQVIHTHLHPDHIGWNVTADGVPMFPNARYCVGKTEFNFWSSDETHEKLRQCQLWRLPDIEPAMSEAVHNNILMLEDRLDVFPDDGTPAPGVQAIPAFGHTPGHLAFEVDLGDETLLVSGDLAVSVVHLEHRNWFAAVDLDPEAVIRTRGRILDGAAENGTLIAGYHLPFPGIGRVTGSACGWNWYPV